MISLAYKVKRGGEGKGKIGRPPSLLPPPAFEEMTSLTSF